MHPSNKVAGDLGTLRPQPAAIRVLLIEDDVRDACLVCQTLQQEAAFAVDHVTRMPEALALLTASTIDVVMLGIGPHEHGMVSLQRVRAAAPDAALVVLIGPTAPDLAAEAMREGAQDYLVRGEMEHRTLPHALLSIIERHRLEQEAARLRKRPFELRDEFLSRVSHQLHLPLASIDSLSAGLAGASAGSLNTQQAEYLNIILNNTIELQKMIEDLLEITQLHAGKVPMHAHPFWLDRLMSKALNASAAQAREKEITLASRYEAHLPQAFADGRLVLRVLRILLENAVKFTPARGAICVEAARYRDKSGFLLVEVCDTGCGLRPEAAARIFEHLYQVTDPSTPETRARRGLGMGLHIGRELITLMGGEIWALSEPQKGSRFCFTLPAFPFELSPGIA
jgi:signal transduction histidine kinase